MYCPRNSVRKGLGSRSKALLPSRKATAALGCGKATAKENASLDTGQKGGLACKPSNCMPVNDRRGGDAGAGLF